MKVLSLDFGGTSVKYGILDENAQIIYQNAKDAPLHSQQEYLDTIISLYREYQNEVEGIAISMPGKIHSNFGFIETAGSYTQIKELSIVDALKDEIRVPVSIENDGKCGALAELWKGGLEGIHDGIVVTIGTAIGGAVIIDRKLHHGKDLSAGEFSFMMGSAGAYGLKERIGTLIGMSGLILRVTQAMGIAAGSQKTLAVFQKRAGNGRGIDVGDLDGSGMDCPVQVDGQMIFKWVEENNPVVVPIYRSFIQSLAMFIYNLYVVFDPEKILIGGGVSNQPVLLRDLEEEFCRIREGVTFAPISPIRVETCHFKADANLIGAAYWFFQKYKIQTEERKGLNGNKQAIGGRNCAPYIFDQ